MIAAIGTQSVFGRGDSGAELQVPSRSVLDLQQDRAALFVDLRHGGVTANGLDQIDCFAMRQEQIAGALILIVETGLSTPFVLLQAPRGSHCRERFPPLRSMQTQAHRVFHAWPRPPGSRVPVFISISEQFSGDFGQ